MIVTEQIDAMRALGTDPMKKLVAPRVAATVFMLFFLSIISDLLVWSGGGRSPVSLLGSGFRQYWSSAWQILKFQDVFMGLLKPVVFGFIIATVGCYYGMSAHGGTQGVGRATTQAVVAASVLILLVDFFITKFLMAIFGTAKLCLRLHKLYAIAVATQKPLSPVIVFEKCRSHSRTNVY